jgi:hypothetical protein
LQLRKRVNARAQVTKEATSTQETDHQERFDEDPDNTSGRSNELHGVPVIPAVDGKTVSDSQ